MPTTVSQTKRSAKVLYRWCLVDGRLDPSRVKAVVKHMLQRKRRGYLAVLGEFKRLIALECARHRARVECAVPLQTDLQSRLRENLESVYGDDLTIEFALNSDLIGGIRIRVANDVYDSSVKARLVALAKSFGIERGEKVAR